MRSLRDDGKFRTISGLGLSISSRAAYQIPRILVSDIFHHHRRIGLRKHMRSIFRFDLSASIANGIVNVELIPIVGA